MRKGGCILQSHVIIVLLKLPNEILASMLYFGPWSCDKNDTNINHLTLQDRSRQDVWSQHHDRQCSNRVSCSCPDFTKDSLGRITGKILPWCKKTQETLAC
ncbi:hypothetical protein NPIL_564441 [Nephila pilipes]|uniref:Secreted protein n=1 Tax=Nephila pilipes TaxID=299642 RepID=A0A8X6PSQ3_NEPPI|nr:hypothetical protein NPIL_564441 [Nephila pilipes]